MKPCKYIVNYYVTLHLYSVRGIMYIIVSIVYCSAALSMMSVIKFTAAIQIRGKGCQQLPKLLIMHARLSCRMHV